MATSQDSARTPTVDVHGHMSRAEVQDIEDEFDKYFQYGMSHRDNLLLMDAVGVDKQIIHCCARRGTAFQYLHKYVRRVMREYPDRFGAITCVDERKLPHDEGLERIRRDIEDWGFNAWWFAPWPPEELVAAGLDPKDWGEPSPFYYFDHERYDPMWELVESLGVPACVTASPQNFTGFAPALLNVLQKHPDLTVVVVHGIDPPSCLRDDGSVYIPEAAVRMVAEHNVYIELLTGIDVQRGQPNRYGPNDEIIKAFYDTFGPSRLMWGSEFTSIERPTVKQYRHQFDYMKAALPLHDRRRPRPNPRRQRRQGLRPLALTPP